jgi:peptidoglycan/LPS O-acetylase OafA/YrhL
MLPGLWVMLVITSIIIFAAFSTVAPQANPGWWSYIWRNLLVQGGVYFIDGAFAANPEPNLVNGSLWTISREVHCYVMLAALGALGLLKNRRLILILWLTGAALHMALPKDLIPFLTELRWLAVSFFAGVLISLWQDRMPISAPFCSRLAARRRHACAVRRCPGAGCRCRRRLCPHHLWHRGTRRPQAPERPPARL